ncbi:MAG: energy-coupling factor transporter transmembrane protein EcfT [Anaerolineales bacterium]|nr:energy-coupling factor transporter transmembrane protein EcfT [Anaerolineales bacterium]
MSFNADLYVERTSWAHKMDPRIKVVYVGMGIITILLFKNVFVILLALMLSHLLIALSNIPRDRITWVWKRMTPINILIPTLFVIFYPEGPVLFEIWFFKFTILALLRGAALAFRLDAIAFLVFSWMFTTDQTKIVRSFVRLGLPFNAGLVLAISLRYIPTFYGLFTTVSEAQKARALDLDKGSFFERLRQYIPILVAMIISALRTADKLAMALESRALGVKGVKRTCLRDITFRQVDYVYLGLILVAFVAAIYLRFGLGVGVDLVNPLP